MPIRIGGDFPVNVSQLVTVGALFQNGSPHNIYFDSTASVSATDYGVLLTPGASYNWPAKSPLFAITEPGKVASLNAMYGAENANVGTIAVGGLINVSASNQGFNVERGAIPLNWFTGDTVDIAAIPPGDPGLILPSWAGGGTPPAWDVMHDYIHLLFSVLWGAVPSTYVSWELRTEVYPGSGPTSVYLLCQGNILNPDPLVLDVTASGVVGTIVPIFGANDAPTHVLVYHPQAKRWDTPAPGTGLSTIPRGQLYLYFTTDGDAQVTVQAWNTPTKFSPNALQVDMGGFSYAFAKELAGGDVAYIPSFQEPTSLLLSTDNTWVAASNYVAVMQGPVSGAGTIGTTMANVHLPANSNTEVVIPGGNRPYALIPGGDGSISWATGILNVLYQGPRHGGI